MTPECRDLLKELYRLRFNDEEAAATVSATETALTAAGFAIVPLEPTERMLANGVNALIVAGLDSEDGVGHSDAKVVWSEMVAASQDKETV